MSQQLSDDALREISETSSISIRTLRYRLSHGWPIDQLTRPVLHQPVTDPTGRQFTSIAAMCRAWNTTPERYQSRIKRGWSQEEALTQNSKHDPHIIKPDGTYQTVKEFCDELGITTTTYYHRKRAGQTDEEIARTAEPVKDHLGQIFPNFLAMTKHWHQTRETVRSRLQSGWTLEKALSEPAKQQMRTDHTGITFPSLNDMLAYYGINRATFFKRQKKGYSLRDTLTVLPDKSVLTPHLTIQTRIEDIYYLVLFDQQTDIWTHRQILNHLHAYQAHPDA